MIQALRSKLPIRLYEIHQNRLEEGLSILVANLTPWDPIYVQRLHQIQDYLSIHLAPVAPHRQSQYLIHDLLKRQSQFLAFVQSFRMLAAISVLSITASFLFFSGVETY